MKSSWRHWCASVIGLVALVGMTWSGDASARQFVGVRVSSGKKIVTMNAGVSARSFANLQRRGFRHVVRVWKHDGKRWANMYTRTLRKASWQVRLAKARTCRGYRGRMVVQIALGRQHRGKWYNPRTRKWQVGFVPFQNQMQAIICGRATLNTRARVRPGLGVKRRAVRGSTIRPRASAGRVRGMKQVGRYGNAWRGMGHFRGRYGNAWRPVKAKGRYGNAWRGTKKVKGRYGNAWRGAKKKGTKSRYGNAWRK